MQIQFDKANLKVIETGEGWLKAEISIAKPGVFEYIDDGRISYQAKLPADILSKSTVDSARGVPITNDHPSRNGEKVLIDNQNYQAFSRGNVSEPRVEGDTIKALATIYDAALIQDIKAKKKREASIGFLFELDPTPGEFGGVKYDSVQKNIKINHVAIVESGRAGKDIKLHIDKKETNIMKWTVDGQGTSNLLTYRMNDGSSDIQVAPEIHSELMTLANDSKDKVKLIADLEKENKELKEKVEKFENDSKDKVDEKVKELQEQLNLEKDKADSWKAKFDELEKSIPETIEKQSKDRSDLIQFAKSVNSEMKFDGLTNREIKEQIIGAGLPFDKGVKVSELSDEIISARFDAACELLKAKATIKDDKAPQTGIDAKTLEEKREALKTKYQENQKRLNEGGN